VYVPFANTIGLLAYVGLTVHVFVMATEVSVVPAAAGAVIADR
jgi:hypothetical protein